MDRALVIISDNNKGRFVAKGFSDAFKQLNFFVTEKKISDLNSDEIKIINPAVIFIFWTDMSQREELIDFLLRQNLSSVYIHCSETHFDIPDNFKNKLNHYIFTSDSKIKKNRYIPGINSKDYKTSFKGYKYNITFAGNPAYKQREIILSKLIYNFGPINIFCRSYDFYKSMEEIRNSELLNDYFLELYKSSYKGFVKNIEELSKIYSSSKINIDIENDKNKFINYRCFEITASGGFLIAPYNKEIIKYFEPGKEIETWENEDELTDKISFYLDNLNIALLITAKGKIITTGNHSVYSRLKEMLKVIYGKNIDG